MTARFLGGVGYVPQINDNCSVENNSLQRFHSYHQTDTWREENTAAMYPRLKLANSSDNNRRASTFWMRDADFVRLKQL